MSVTIELFQEGEKKASYSAKTRALAFEKCYREWEEDIRDECDVFEEDADWMEDAVQCWWDTEGQWIDIEGEEEPETPSMVIYAVQTEHGTGDLFLFTTEEEAIEKAGNRLDIDEFRWINGKWEAK